MGAFIYDTNGMLLFSGLDKAAALAYAKLFELTQFTLIIREPRKPGAIKRQFKQVSHCGRHCLIAAP